MNININLFIYNGEEILPLLKQLKEQGVRIMGALDDLKQELVEINEATNELATDVDDLISKMGTGAISEEEAQDLRSSLIAVKDKLKGTAAKHTPESGGGTNEPPFDPVAGQRRNR